jgi:hypothetical protein
MQPAVPGGLGMAHSGIIDDEQGQFGPDHFSMRSRAGSGDLAGVAQLFGREMELMNGNGQRHGGFSPAQHRRRSESHFRRAVTTPYKTSARNL